MGANCSGKFPQWGGEKERWELTCPSFEVAVGRVEPRSS